MFSTIPHFLSFLVLISNMGFVIFLALFLFSARSRVWLSAHVSRYVLQYTLLFSLVASLGSLALSNIVGFVPCDLCWFQRIFMYPQAIISLTALIRSRKVQRKGSLTESGIEKRAIYYTLPLSIIGFLISLYHSYIQWGGTHSVLPCTLDGGSCGKLYVYAYQYITIPSMALSAFIYLLVVAGIYVYTVRAKK